MLSVVCILKSFCMPATITGINLKGMLCKGKAQCIYYGQIILHMFPLFVISRSIAKELADWLISNNVVEHIFGPNLHIEVCIKFLLVFSTDMEE